MTKNPLECIIAPMNTFEAMKNPPPRLPLRAAESSKRDYGRLLIIAGSVGYTGAPSLAARAAVRGGAGLVYLGVPRDIYAIEAVKCEEAMPFPLPSDGEGRLSADALPEILRRAEKCDCVAAGPGLGRSEGLVALISGLIRQCEAPLVLDADALWAVSRAPGVLKEARAPVVITPHEGEFARLGGNTEGERYIAALEFSRRYGCRTVLKGHRSAIAFPDGGCYINPTGNPGMARGGSGDVLTGLMAALICQLPLDDAVRAVVYLHGYAGDICAARLGEYGMTPSDMIEALPAAMKEHGSVRKCGDALPH